MKTIAVAAPAAESGKSLLICRVLEAFPGRITAVKLSDHPPDPRPARVGSPGLCSCESAGSPFHVIEDNAALGDPGKDTGRFLAAGARRVLWCQSSKEDVSDAWSHMVRCHLERDEIVIAEGSRLLATTRPEILVLVVNPERPRVQWKNGGVPLLARADLVLWNRHPRPSGKIDSVEEAARELEGMAGPIAGEGRILTGDFTQPLRSAFPKLHAMLAAEIWG